MISLINEIILMYSKKREIWNDFSVILLFQFKSFGVFMFVFFVIDAVTVYKFT
jgi:hypothetical protein